MTRIKIKNFGPIREGLKETFNDGTLNEWIDVKKVTVFIGNQGSGKSTVAKLISTMTWMEKALSREDVNEEILTTEDFFKHFEYQRIEKYFKADSHIEYDGEFVHIIVNRDINKCQIIKKGDLKQLNVLPQIMYVPAERNFLTVVQDAYNVTNIPDSLRTFGEELKKSLLAINGNLLTLPIDKLKVKYEKFKDKMFLVHDDYDLEISDASSGYQSLVPLFLVTKYLSEEMENHYYHHIPSKLTINQSIRMQAEIDTINAQPFFAEQIKLLKIIEVHNKYYTKCLINIVEEPEQNLFPTSQRILLYSLLEFNNKIEGNKLIMTTHSPYLINYLTHAVKASKVLEKIDKSNNKVELREKLQEIVPIQSAVGADDWVVYELNETDGSILKLKDYKGLPSDSNYLNERMAEGNEIFGKLLDIEDLCQ